jgi:hypothetical protein
MRRTGVSDLPLHGGKAPAWLFKRMVPLARHITEAIVDEYSQWEFLKRVADPFWFQAFGCVLGFDWHSSGLSTTVTGALKDGLKDSQAGLAVCGGKGRASRRAPQEIVSGAEDLSLSQRRVDELVHASRLSAKVDNTALQDGYQLYHHCFMFTGRGTWCVVQQGMNPGNRYARRYHWLSGDVKSFVNEPHEGIACDRREKDVLNMVSRDSGEAREASIDMVRDSPARLQGYLTGQSTLGDFVDQARRLHMPRSHYIIRMDRRNLESLRRAHEIQPENYEALLDIPGIGPKSVRALALIADLVYGKPASWEDPVKFSFSHGGKDGIPYPVDRRVYDKSIEVLRMGIEQARLGRRERLGALKRLEGFL